jgi:hypothetical protein
MSDDIATQLGAVQSSLYGTIELEGTTYKIPYVNGLPGENVELIEAGEAVEKLKKDSEEMPWVEISEIFGRFGVAVLGKLNPDLKEREARLLSTKGNTLRMYSIWGKS